MNRVAGLSALVVVHNEAAQLALCLERRNLLFRYGT